MPMNFEIKAIRPWTRARRGRRNGNPPAPPVAQAENLATVLEEYDQRLETKALEARSVADRQKEFHAAAASLVETVITPSLESLGRQVAEHGHHWEVEKRVDILGQPSIACSFAPRETGDNDVAAGEISFRFQFPDRLVVSAVTPDGSEIRDLPPRSYEIGKVGPTMIADEVTRFVARSLR